MAGTPKIIPWREVSPVKPGDVQATVEALGTWSRATDTVLISVEPYAAELLREITFAAPKLTYVPGIKTASILRDSGILSRSAWQQLYASVQLVMSYTGSQVVLLEHESALSPYYSGDKPVPRPDLLAEVVPPPLSTMPLLWYPSAADSGARLQRYLEMASAVRVAFPMARMVEHVRLWGPGSPSDQAANSMASMLEQRCNRPPLPMFYCHYSAGRPAAWPNDRLEEAASLARTADVICYPGADNWAGAATALARALRPVTPQAKPVRPPAPKPPSVQNKE